MFNLGILEIPIDGTDAAVTSAGGAIRAWVFQLLSCVYRNGAMQAIFPTAEFVLKIDVP